MLPTLTVLAGVTPVLVGGPILTPSSNPALRGVNLEVVGGTTQDGFDSGGGSFACCGEN